VSAAPELRPGGRRLALLVANTLYQDPGLRQLRAPASDASALEAILADPEIGDYETKLVLDRPSYEILEEVEGFCLDRRRDDLLVIYFSCHGIKDEDGVLYFAAANTKLDRLRATGVPSAFVKNQVERTRSRRVLVLLDCCYSGAFGAFGPKARGVVDVTGRLSGHGRAVVAASSAMEYAFERSQLTLAEGTRSVFTDSMIHGLRTGVADTNGDGMVSVDEFYDYIYDEVRRVTPSQTPHMVSELQGELYMAKSPRGPQPDLLRLIPQPRPPSDPIPPDPTPQPRPPDGLAWWCRARWRTVAVACALVVVALAALLVWSDRAPGWEPLPDLPQAEEGAGVAAYAGGLWVAGGVSPMTGRPLLDAVQIFDPVARRWSQGPRLPKPIAFASLVPVASRLYLLGGQAADGAVATVLRLDTPTGAWQEDAPLPQAREAGAAAWDGSRLVYAGGVGPDHSASPDVYVLESSRWRLMGQLGVAREKAAVATDGFGTVWVIGGRDSATTVPAYGAVDQVRADRVVAAGSVSPLHGGAGLFWPGYGVCTVGGQTPDGFTGDVRCLAQGGSPPAVSQPRAGLGAAVIGREVIAVGGYDAGSHGTGRADGLTVVAEN